MKSKFRPLAYTYLSIFISHPFIAYLILRKGIYSHDAYFKITYYCLFLLLVLAFLVSVWNLYKRAMMVKFEGDAITARGFYGLGRSNKFKITDFDGFKIVPLTSWAVNSEHLYLMEHNKKAIALSSVFHRNYHDMKQYLEPRMTLLGNMPSNTSTEVKDVFLG